MEREGRGVGGETERKGGGNTIPEEVQGRECSPKSPHWAQGRQGGILDGVSDYQRGWISRVEVRNLFKTYQNIKTVQTVGWVAETLHQDLFNYFKTTDGTQCGARTHS